MNITEYFDDLIDKPSWVRMYFGCEERPAYWCVWSDEEQLWVETDEHFKERIKNNYKDT